MANYTHEVRIYPAPSPRPARRWDIAVTITIYLLSGGAAAVACLYSFSGLFFLDTCPPDECAVVVDQLALGVIAGIVVVVIGMVWGLIRLVLRQLAWPVALGALILAVLAWTYAFSALIPTLSSSSW